VAKQGKIIWGAATVSIIRSPEGELLSTIAVIEDITKRKKAEVEKLELQVKLNRAKKMEALGVLAASVAHDLNNIMSGIMIYPDVILMDNTISEESKKNLKMIQKSAQMASEVVNDLLTISHGVVIEKQPMNIDKIIKEFLLSPEYLRLCNLYPSVSLTTFLNSTVSSIKGSKSHIKKSLLNLIINAFEAISGSGKIEISTSNTRLNEPLKGYDFEYVREYIVLSITDTGKGISEEDLERIFEPFYTKKILGRSGTGLGLTVVWNIVQDHNGQINVVSDSGGTKFELYFPVTRDKTEEEKVEKSFEEYMGNNEKILVVDDEQNQRDILSNILNKLKYRPKVVSSGSHALEYLKEDSVDLVILDMIMDPEMNGRKTYEEILKLHPGQKAIIASGYSISQEVEKTQALGAGQYIKKPYTLEKIGMAIKNELGK
jgi:signal transduction histidine kinase